MMAMSQSVGNMVGGSGMLESRGSLMDDGNGDSDDDKDGEQKQTAATRAELHAWLVEHLGNNSLRLDLATVTDSTLPRKVTLTACFGSHEEDVSRLLQTARWRVQGYIPGTSVLPKVQVISPDDDGLGEGAEPPSDDAFECMEWVARCYEKRKREGAWDVRKDGDGTPAAQPKKLLSSSKLRSAKRVLDIFEDAPGMRLPGVVYDSSPDDQGPPSIPQSATIQGLVDAAIFPTNQDGSYTDTLVSIYYLTTTPLNFLLHLISWYAVFPPADPANVPFYDRIRRPVQNRAISVIVRWIQLRFLDFHLDKQLLDILAKWTDLLEKGEAYPYPNCSPMPPMSCMADGQRIIQCIREQRVKFFASTYVPGVVGLSAVGKTPVGVTDLEQVDASVDVKVHKSNTLMRAFGSRKHLQEGASRTDLRQGAEAAGKNLPWSVAIPAQQFAEMVTIVEHGFFSAVRPEILVTLTIGLVRTKFEGVGRPLCEYLMWQRLLSAYTSTSIVLSENLKRRSHAIKRFIKIAWLCLSHNNFGSAFAILEGLRRSAIMKLTEAWKMIPTVWIGRLKEMEAMVNAEGCWKGYFEKMHEGVYPGVPCLAAHAQKICQILSQTPTSSSDSGSRLEESVPESETSSLNRPASHPLPAGSDTTFNIPNLNAIVALLTHTQLLSLHKYERAASNTQQDPMELLRHIQSSRLLEGPPLEDAASKAADGDLLLSRKQGAVSKIANRISRAGTVGGTVRSGAALGTIGQNPTMVSVKRSASAARISVMGLTWGRSGTVGPLSRAGSTVALDGAEVKGKGRQAKSEYVSQNGS
ncbi:RasGEF [Gonapodya sp. JEL0774]|nr:RasGEF [Gonapodya sp. JEL0774]